MTEALLQRLGYIWEGLGSGDMQVSQIRLDDRGQKIDHIHMHCKAREL